jgi:hypothetical protein
MKQIGSYLIFIALAAMLTQCNSTEPKENYTCSGKKTCGEMRTCSEAKFNLETCGVTNLDADQDGVPCEAGPCD